MVYQVIFCNVFMPTCSPLQKERIFVRENKRGSTMLLVVVMDKLLIKFAKEESKANTKKSKMTVVWVSNTVGCVIRIDYAKCP